MSEGWFSASRTHSGKLSAEFDSELTSSALPAPFEVAKCPIADLVRLVAFVRHGLSLVDRNRSGRCVDKTGSAKKLSNSSPVCRVAAVVQNKPNRQDATIDPSPPTSFSPIPGLSRGLLSLFFASISSRPVAAVPIVAVPIVAVPIVAVPKVASVPSSSDPPGMTFVVVSGSFAPIETFSPMTFVDPASLPRDTMSPMISPVVSPVATQDVTSIETIAPIVGFPAADLPGASDARDVANLPIPGVVEVIGSSSHKATVPRPEEMQGPEEMQESQPPGGSVASDPKLIDDDEDDDDDLDDDLDSDSGIIDPTAEPDTGFADDLDDDDEIDEFDDIDEDDFDDDFDDDFEEELDDDYEIEIDDEISNEFGLNTAGEKVEEEDDLDDFEDFENIAR